MRRLLVLTLGLFLGAPLFYGCGRNGLDDPIDIVPVDTGAAGSAAGSGGAGHAGTTGAAGAGGHAGTIGAAGHGGTSGSAGSGGHAGSIAGAGGGSAGSGGAAGAAGVAGAAGSAGGVAGTGGASCVPGRSEACACADGSMGAQVCQADGTFAACVCDTAAANLARLQKLIVGEWSGTVTTPFTMPYKVRIVFGADGHYSAHCEQGATCPDPVFYYGIDYDDASKTYVVNDLHADGSGSGHIVIFWVANDNQTGDLDAITVDSSRLRFQFWATWNGRIGPFEYDLSRVLH